MVRDDLTTRIDISTLTTIDRRYSPIYKSCQREHSSDEKGRETFRRQFGERWVRILEMASGRFIAFPMITRNFLMVTSAHEMVVTNKLQGSSEASHLFLNHRSHYFHPCRKLILGVKPRKRLGRQRKRYAGIPIRHAGMHQELNFCPVIFLLASGGFSYPRGMPPSCFPLTPIQIA